MVFDLKRNKEKGELLMTDLILQCVVPLIASLHPTGRSDPGVGVFSPSLVVSGGDKLVLTGAYLVAHSFVALSVA